jgi:hypothetical protein
MHIVRTSPLLIQVVPRLKPGRCGVTDHVIPLAEELKAAFGIDTAFVVLNSEKSCELQFPVVYCAPDRLLASSLELSGNEPCAMLVHVSGYGYSANGAPTLLAEALNEVSMDGRFSIAAYFHELFASGPPWTSAFWHEARQKAAIRKIAGLCDLMVTNIELHARWLESETQRKPGVTIQQLPVQSTIGETRERIPSAERAPQMAVFGLAATRKKAYRELAELSGLLRTLGVEKFVDIGADCDVGSEVSGIPVERRGELEASEVAAVLARAKFGFLSYTPLYLAKSSIFAAYCAQGAVPVIATPFDGQIDGLSDGVQVLSPETAQEALASGLDRCSIEARAWYDKHRVRVHATTYARWLNQPELVREPEEARL